MTRALGSLGHLGREPVIGSLCTGYGGLDLGVLAAFGGGTVAWVADPDPHVRRLLAARLPGIPNLGDITDVDWRRVPPIDVITAGFPCQDLSSAGKGAGIRKGTRSGLWYEVIRAVRDLRPHLLVVENVAALRWRAGGLGIVLGSLSASGYDAHWCSVRASDIGAAHRRERLFLLGYRTGTRFTERVADPDGARLPQPGRGGSAADRSDRRQPAGHGGQVAAHPAGQRRCPGGLPAAAPQGGWASGDPARRGHGSVADPSGQQSQRWGGSAPVACAPGGPAGPWDQRQRHGRTVVDRGATVADPEGYGCRDTGSARGDRLRAAIAGRQGPSEPARLERRPDGVLGGGASAADTLRGQQPQQPHGPDGAPVGAGTGTGDRDHPGHPAGGTDRLAPGAARLDATVEWGRYAPAIRRWEAVCGVAAPHPTEPNRHGRPRLSPRFVEWLMGLAGQYSGWVTDLDISRAAKLRILGNGVVPQQAAYAIRLLLADLVALDADHEQEEKAA